MHRYNVVPLILLILSIINFALAAPVLRPEKDQVSVDVVHVPKDVITVLGKRGDNLEKMMKLFKDFDKWWVGEEPVRLPSSSAPSGSMQEHAPPVDPASSSESDRDPESSVGHPPTPSNAPSTEPVSDLDREAMGVDHDSPPSNTESLIESGHSHTLPTDSESERWYTAPSSPVSDSDTNSDRWSTISNAPSAESLLEKLKTVNNEPEGKGKVSGRSTGNAIGAVNAAQSVL